MKKISNLTVGIICGMVFLVVYNLTSFAYNCNEIRENVLRLHIIADSDNKTDQEIKLKVRDELLKHGFDIFDGCVNIENAIQMIEPQLEAIEETANTVIRSNGYDYKAEAKLTTEYFDTRVYDDFTLPAGEYLALKIVLGSGEGKNWWCVMFPTLCLPAAEKKTDINAVFNNEQVNIISDKSKYKIRFRIIEIIEEFKQGDILSKGDIA